MTKIEYGNSEKSFFEWEKNGFKKHLPALCPRDFFFYFFIFVFALLISNHALFLFNLKLICAVNFSKKVEITLAEAARAISAFWKTHSCKSIPNWTRNRMITFTNSSILELHLQWSITYRTTIIYVRFSKYFKTNENFRHI